MTPASELSLQDRLSEELGLLPGRISRTFYVLATLDAQASFVNSNLHQTQVQLLENLNASTKASPSILHQLSALRQLHQVQRQLLTDKLFVDKKASEWVTRAKNAVHRYSVSQELNRRIRINSLNDEGLVAHQALEPTAISTERHRKRCTISSVDELEGSAAAFYGSRTEAGSPTSSVVQPKRKRVSASGDFSLPPGISHHRKSNRGGSSSNQYRHHHRQHTHHHSGSRITSGLSGIPPFQIPTGVVTSTPLLPSPGETFTIKLGSLQQKGRPRKSGASSLVTATGNNQAAETPVVADAPVLPDSMVPTSTYIANEIEEYFCPICHKSDFEDPSMVACDSCDQWYHCRCVGFQDLADAESSKNFYCKACRDSRNLETLD